MVSCVFVELRSPIIMKDAPSLLIYVCIHLHILNCVAEEPLLRTFQEHVFVTEVQQPNILLVVVAPVCPLDE